MDVYYLCSSVFVFLLKWKNKKTENSVKIYATLVGADVFKKFKNMSGGERMRLKLAQLMQQEINLLILDEPTNHLDIESREVLEENLEQFEGTIIAISHDRYFLQKLFDRIVWIEKQRAIVHEGDYAFAKEKQAMMMELSQ